MHPYYERDIYGSPENFAKTVKRMVELIRSQQYKFQAIAALGNSGVPIAAALSLRMKKHLIVVRANGVKSHDGHQLCGPYKADAKLQSYIIMDDLVDSGQTINRIHKYVSKDYSKIVLNGVFCYSTRVNTTVYVEGNKISPTVPVIYT